MIASARKQIQELHDKAYLDGKLETAQQLKMALDYLDATKEDKTVLRETQECLEHMQDRCYRLNDELDDLKEKLETAKKALINAYEDRKHVEEQLLTAKETIVSCFAAKEHAERELAVVKARLSETFKMIHEGIR